MAGMIVLFQGCRGCGKTLSMTYWSEIFSRFCWKVYSNYSIIGVDRIIESDLINLDKNSVLRDCVILIDEMQIFFDSRSWKSGNSIGFSHFIQQIRKRNIVILGTTQYIDTIEKRIRQHIDILIKPKFNKKTMMCKNLVFDITSLEDSKVPLYFTSTFYAPNIFPKYNTNEML